MGNTRMIVAVSVVVVRAGRVLAMKRAATKDAGAGAWEVVSGRVEAGEDPASAALREVHEETGLEVTLHPRPVDTYAAMRGSEPMVVIVFRADAADGASDVRLSAEHDAFAWSTPEEARALTPFSRLRDAIDRAVAAG
ncbi:MAG: NUDIX domain-containing protein [Polyangiales bacterium]|nr:NUDIX domain-containing protein [Myxococcales bacterium]